MDIRQEVTKRVERPLDEYTAQHCISQVVGFGTRLNGFGFELKQHNEIVDELRKEIEILKAARKEDVAKIGELIGRVEELETWKDEIERLRKAKAEAQKTGSAA